MQSSCRSVSEGVEDDNSKIDLFIRFFASEYDEQEIIENKYYPDGDDNIIDEFLLEVFRSEYDQNKYGSIVDKIVIELKLVVNPGSLQGVLNEELLGNFDPSFFEPGARKDHEVWKSLRRLCKGFKGTS